MTFRESRSLHYNYGKYKTVAKMLLVSSSNELQTTLKFKKKLPMHKAIIATLKMFQKECNSNLFFDS